MLPSVGAFRRLSDVVALEADSAAPTCKAYSNIFAEFSRLLQLNVKERPRRPMLVTSSPRYEQPDTLLHLAKQRSGVFTAAYPGVPKQTNASDGVSCQSPLHMLRRKYQCVRSSDTQRITSKLPVLVLVRDFDLLACCQSPFG